MGKNKSASNLVNVIDFNNDRIAFISGSTTLMSISSSGAITTTGVISGSNAASASYALNAGLLNNKDSAEFTSTGSFNAYTASNDATVTSVAAAAVSAVAGVNALAARTSSYTTTSSFNSYTSSNDVTMSCVSSTATSAIVGVGTLASKTGSYATTGSNVFDGGQYLSSSFNPTGFSTTASLYTDGGLRVTKDAYISGTLYLNNVTVYGTQSVCYITSSQLNIASNLISVNTSTPSVRFGGLAVYDSGSTGLTGSILWDSENNHWVYSNPSGSSYSGGMFISGPRTSTLGSETGTTSCMLLAGQGGDHLTSSMIYHSSTATCIPNTLIGSTVCTTMINTSCISIGTQTPSVLLDISKCSASNININSTNLYLNQGNLIQFCQNTTGGAVVGYIGHAGDSTGDLTIFNGGTKRIALSSTGITTFSCQTCALSFYSNTTSGRAFGNDSYAGNFGWISMYNNCGGIQIGMEGSTGGQLITGACPYEGVVVGKCYLSLSGNNGGTRHLAIGYGGDVGIGIAPRPGDGKLQLSLGTAVTWGNSNSAGGDYSWISDGSYNFSSGNALVINTEKARPVVIGTCGVARFCVGANGISTFSCQVCAPRLTLSNGTTGTMDLGQISTGGVANQIIGGQYAGYAYTGRLSFKVGTWGAGSDYGPTEQMFMEVQGADTKRISMGIATNGGYVGIGTSSPVHILDINDCTGRGMRLNSGYDQGDLLLISNKLDSARFTINNNVPLAAFRICKGGGQASSASYSLIGGHMYISFNLRYAGGYDTSQSIIYPFLIASAGQGGPNLFLGTPNCITGFDNTASTTSFGISMCGISDTQATLLICAKNSGFTIEGSTSITISIVASRTAILSNELMNMYKL